MDKPPRTRREREIWQACDDLYALDIPFSKMTGDAIRDQLVELGFRRGSPNEVYKYRKSWQLSRGIEVTSLTKDEGVSLSDPIARAAALVHESIQIEAQALIAEIKKEAADQIACAEQQTVQLRQDLDLLQQKYDPLLMEFNQLRQDHQTLKESHLIVQERYAQTQEQIKTHQGSLIKTENDHEKRLVELKLAHHKIIVVLQANLTQSKQTMQQMTHELKTTQENNHRHITEINKLKSQQQQLEKQITSIHWAEQKIQTSNEALKAQIKRLEMELKQVVADHQITLQKLHENDKIIARHKGELTQVSALADTRQKQLEKTQMELMAQQEKIGRLETQIIYLKKQTEVVSDA